MQFRSLCTAGLVMGAVLLAPNTGSADAGNIYHATLAEADVKSREISTEAMKRILQDGSALVIDTRSQAEFDAGHIPGAMSLGGSTNHVATLDKLVLGNKAKPLALYCNGPFCQASRRLGEQLMAAGFTNVQRYQLGMPVWRALGGPVEIELDGIKRILNLDRTAVFLDARSSDAYARGTIPGAQSMPVEDMQSGKLKKPPLPEDDFNRRIVLFGGEAGEARKLADVLSKRPWHNVSYFAGPFEALVAATKGN